MCKSDYCSHDSDVGSASMMSCRRSWWTNSVWCHWWRKCVSHYLNDETIFPARFEINTNILFSDDIVIVINFHHGDIVQWNTDPTLLRFLEPLDSLLFEMTIPQHLLITLVKWIWPIRYHEKRILTRNGWILRTMLNNKINSGPVWCRCWLWGGGSSERSEAELCLTTLNNN